jgi:hypothetical protein
MRFRVVALVAAAAAVGLSGTGASAQTVPDDKIVEGWNTPSDGVVEHEGRTYCIQIKTIASIDAENAFGTIKARLLKTKNSFCDKRVKNLNVTSSATVSLEGEQDCFDDATTTLESSGQKVIKAVASDLLFDGSVEFGDCEDGFTVSGATTMLVGKEKHGSPPISRTVTQDGPDFPPIVTT